MGSIVLPPTVEVREGTTDRLIMQLLADDSPIDLMAVHHFEVEMRDRRRNTYRYSSTDASPKVGIQAATSGKIYLEPPASLFKTILSPYLGYVWVFDTALSKFSVPEEVEFMIQVRRNY